MPGVGRSRPSMAGKPTPAAESSNEPRRSNQRPALQALENAERRALGLRHRLHRQEERLLQHELAGHHRMRRLVGEAYPHATRWKRHRFLRTGLLIIEVGL